MIESVHFENYKVLRDTTLPLGRFTLLIGPNGSGKSTALQGIRIPGGGFGFEDLSIGPPPDGQNIIEIEIRWGDKFHGVTWSCRCDQSNKRQEAFEGNLDGTKKNVLEELNEARTKMPSF